MRKSVILVLMLVFSFIAEAQTLPTEKVFFASDRISYQLGDTIRIAGWLMRCDDKTGEPYSRYLYVELTNGKDNILRRQKLGVDEQGAFHTVMPIDRPRCRHQRLVAVRKFPKARHCQGDVGGMEDEIPARGDQRHKRNGLGKRKELEAQGRQHRGLSA